MDINRMSLNDIWTTIENIADERSDLITDLNATYCFEITGDDPGNYTIKFENGNAEITGGLNDNADCTLTMGVDFFKQLIQGKANATTAFMTGRLKVKGNIGLALKLESAFKKYDI